MIISIDDLFEKTKMSVIDGTFNTLGLGFDTFKWRKRQVKRFSFRISFYFLFYFYFYEFLFFLLNFALRIALQIYGYVVGVFLKLELLEILAITEEEFLNFIVKKSLLGQVPFSVLLITFLLFAPVDRSTLTEDTWITLITTSIMPLMSFTSCIIFSSSSEAVSGMFRCHFCPALNLLSTPNQPPTGKWMAKLDILAILIGALCHDIAHPGVNNLYQVHARTKLAIMYNDISVIENYSCAMTFNLANKHGLFRNLNRADYRSLRATIIQGSPFFYLFSFFFFLLHRKLSFNRPARHGHVLSL